MQVSASLSGGGLSTIVELARGLPGQRSSIAPWPGSLRHRGSSHPATDAAPAGLVNNTKRNNIRHQPSTPASSKHGRSTGAPLEVGHTRSQSLRLGSHTQAGPRSVDLFAQHGTTSRWPRSRSRYLTDAVEGAERWFVEGPEGKKFDFLVGDARYPPASRHATRRGGF